MGLTEYRRKRNFRVTSEPRGGPVKARKRRSFVIQKHAASHLHYDFRLELDGVLKSWAVPKGPSLDPANKRLAMQVEDHPLEYGDFEGIIPEGEYGGGTVLLWDQGTWEPVEDGSKGYRDGALKFILHGEKLQGKWMLVRRGGKRGGDSERNWFLFKVRDEFAKPGSDIAAESPLSVTTGRDLDEIAAQADRVWGPDGEAPGSKRAKRKAASKAVRAKPKRKAKSTAAQKARIAKALKEVGGKPAGFPKQAQVQLATLAKRTPDGDDWLHEIKFDGYRMLCQISDGKVRFISRNGKDWTKNFAGLSREAAALPVENAILDGEVVVLEPDGRTSFQALQNAFETGKAPFLFYVFDLLYLNGVDVRDATIEDRKAVLRAVIPGGDESPIKFSDHVVGNGATMFAEAARLKLEGIVSKRLGRAYTGRRTPDWLKVKCSLREEFAIGGFTRPSGGRKHFGALAIGYYDRNGNFIYAGREDQAKALAGLPVPKAAGGKRAENWQRTSSGTGGASCQSATSSGTEPKCER
jgi:bifunctional non-homologous end joining protein LigD